MERLSALETGPLALQEFQLLLPLPSLAAPRARREFGSNCIGKGCLVAIAYWSCVKSKRSKAAARAARRSKPGWPPAPRRVSAPALGPARLPARLSEGRRSLRFAERGEEGRKRRLRKRGGERTEEGQRGGTGGARRRDKGKRKLGK